MTLEELQAQLAQVQAENAKLKVKVATQSTISFKVSENKHCVSVYGLMKRPVTLYASQFIRLLDKKDDILAFIEAHRKELAWKDEDKE